MVLNKFFKGKGKKGEPEQALTTEDLITLERYEEAEERLKLRLKKFPKDLHAHLKLAEVYLSRKSLAKALDEYIFVGDSYADDGFFEKGIALLSKAVKLAPGDDMLPRRIARYRRLKKLEHRRRLVIDGLRENHSAGALASGESELAVQLLWAKIAKSHLVESLSGKQLQRLFSVMEMLQIEKGRVLADAGSSVPVMYLIVDGVIEARQEVLGKDMDIRSFSTGDLIGDAALFERKVWPAQYKAEQGCTLFRLTREGLEQAMQGDDDPRGFISVLRRQQNDRDVAASVARLEAGR